MPNITKRGNAYRIRVSNGRDASGKQIIETATFHPDPNRTEKQNQKALQQFALDFERKVKSGNYLEGEKITFSEFVDKWRTLYAKEQLQDTTVEFYDFLLKKHILPAIGNVKLAQLRPAHLIAFYDDLSHKIKPQKGDGDPATYSTTTVRRCHACISSILQTAVYWNVITENPCKRVQAPRTAQATDDVKHFTPEQASAFLEALDAFLDAGKIQLQHVLLFHLALFCGLRRGELVALTWDDLDFDQKQVSVSKSAAVVNGEIVNKVPKNKSSYRLVSVPASVITLARKYKSEQQQYRLSIGSKWAGSNFIFIQWNGEQMYPSTPYTVFKRVLRQYNEGKDPADQLPLIPFHGLRHTSATLLISQNIDVKTVSGRLGHAQTSTTMNIYSHALRTKDQGAAETLEDLFYKNKRDAQ